MDHPSSPAHDAFVSLADSEAFIGAATGDAPDRSAGIFGPASISWKINRESALFLGAGRAALLQLAHPWVATALEQHSGLLEKPIARFHNTFRVVFTMIFGTVDQAASAARHLYGLHTHIQGQMTEQVAAFRRGSHYRANEINALRWVYATLVESAVLAYECVLPALGRDELEAYYAESRSLAALFGLPAAALPPDWAGFLDCCRAMEQSNELGVSDRAKTMAHRLLAGAGSWLRPPGWYCALTAAWLPARLRDEFDLAFVARRRYNIQAVKRRLAATYGKLPERVRFVGPSHEARERLAGRSAGILTRVSNRFWIGEPFLPFA